jgi:hypothetical protein
VIGFVNELSPPCGCGSGGHKRKYEGNFSKIVVVGFMIDVHVYLYILQEIFEINLVAIEDLGFIEVEFFCSVGGLCGLSHGDRMDRKGLIKVLDGSEEVFNRGARPGFSEIA